VRIPRYAPIAVLAVLLGITASCGIGGAMSDYVKTVQSGIARLPWPKEMETLFGDSDHFITHYGFSPGPKIWTSEVFIYGRYRLSMQADVEIDYENNLVKTNVGPAKFYLFETGSIIHGPRGVEGANIVGQWIFDEAKWDKLVQSKGDWSLLGIPVKTNSPVPEFDAYVSLERAPVVKIPH
jgi:hypothetical protein